MYTYGTILLNSSYNEKCFRQNVYRKSEHTFHVQQLSPKVVYDNVERVSWSQTGHRWQYIMALKRCDLHVK